MEVYKDLDKLPTGRATDEITEGCMVLEGGGWKALYTLGALDALMLNGINMSATVGISAGAMSAVGYVSGQIGWAAGINLRYRNDKNYIGVGAMKTDHGVTGFTYLFDTILKEHPVDKARLMDDSRRLAIGVTNMLTGQTEYMEKGKCNLSAAVRASATVPYVSRPVVIGGVPYLDGGCSTKIPYPWAVEQGYKKIIVIKTREWDYRRNEAPRKSNKMYRKYPEFVKSLNHANSDFNEMTDELFTKNSEGRIYVIAPSEVVTVSRFESDLDKIGDLYWLGYNDAMNSMDDIKDYLARETTEVEEDEEIDDYEF